MLSGCEGETYSHTCCLVVRCGVSPTVCRVSGQVQVSQFNIDYRYTPFYFSRAKNFSINSNLYHLMDMTTNFTATECVVWE